MGKNDGGEASGLGQEEEAFPYGNTEGEGGDLPGLGPQEAAAAPEAAPTSEEAPLPPPGGEEATRGQPAPHPADCDGQTEEVEAKTITPDDVDDAPAPAKPEEPKPTWPEDYLSAKHEFYIERPDSPAHASYQRPAYFSELDTEAANVVVQAGDHIECTGSFKDLRAALVEHYDIRGPIETLLLERLLELHWRLRRVQAIERGLIERQTIGVKTKRMVERVEQAQRGEKFAVLGKKSPFASTNPYEVQFARDKVEELVAALKDGVDAFDVIFKDLGDAMGRDAHQMPNSVGGAVAWLVFAAPKQGVTTDKIRAELITVLSDLAKKLAKHEEELHRDMKELDEAEVQSLRGVTDPQRLRALAAMERGLQGQMLEVLSELERRVAWRRVGEQIRTSHQTYGGVSSIG